MDLKNIPEETWIRWKKKRRTTLIGYIIVGIMVGIDYSFMFTTLYLYLKDVIKSQHPNLFYGIIIAAYSLSSTLFGVLCGRWVDHTRKIKLYTIAILVVQIIGCLLYVIHFNVAFPLIGRVIGGLGDPFPSVTTGEIIRIYNKEESTRALWWLASVYSVGFMVGPVFVLFFKNVDFYIWTIHFTQLNVIALFMAGLLFVTLIIVNFLIHDCSAEIDLKQYLQENVTESTKERRRNKCENATEETSLLQSPSNIGFYTLPIRVVLGTLFCNVDAVLMFLSTFVFMYCLFASDVILPLITVILLEWSLTALTFIFIANGVVYLILLMVMSKYCTQDAAVYYISIVCIVAQIFLFLVMIAMKVAERNLTRDIIFMALFVLFWVFAWVIEEVLIRCMLSKLVPSNCQSFTESFRNAISRLSTIVASITAPLVIPVLHWWSTGLIIIMFTLLLAFIRRRKTLTNIKEIDFELSHRDVNIYT